MRIKTKAEFIKEYGDDWRMSTKLTYRFPGEMDSLLGKQITEGEYLDIKNVKSFTKTIGNYVYAISKEMITSSKLDNIKESLCS